MFLFTLVVSLLLPWIASANAAITYSCATPSTGPHCYGISNWYSNLGSSSHNYTGFNHFTGAYTSPNIVQLTTGNGSIDEEVWLVDNNTLDGSPNYHSCYLHYDFTLHALYNDSGVTNQTCWVETGYYKANNVNSGNEVWFWGEVKPLDGYNPNTSPVTLPYCAGAGVDALEPCAFHIHYGATLQSGDYANHGDEEVYADPSTAHQWDVYGHSASTQLLDLSSNNYMNPTEIQIGSELSGSQNANGPKVHFINNQYQTSAGGSWSYHTVDPELVSNNPPLAAWVSGKLPSQSLTGGDFVTCTFTGCTI